MSEAAGQDLDWYFQQALTQPGHPILEIRWQHRRQKLTLDVAQTQPQEWGVYRIPNLIIRVDGTPVRIEVNGRQSRIGVEGIRKKPKTIEVDPRGWWLMRTSVNGER
jgi:aminopeptidase N